MTATDARLEPASPLRPELVEQPYVRPDHVRSHGHGRTRVYSRHAITVALVVNLVANGMSADNIIREYPDLESEDIRQALQYASALANEQIGFFNSPAA